MSLEWLGPERMGAAASLWKRERRRLAARFTGGSMSPGIPSGSELIVACGESGENGDVVVVLLGSQVRVHRLVASGRDGRWILTRGDATCVPDPPARADAVLGRVVALGGNPLPRAAVDTWVRRAVLVVCRGLLRISPGACDRLLRSVWLLRRWLVVVPAAGLRRLVPRGRARPEEDQAEPRQETRQ